MIRLTILSLLTGKKWHQRRKMLTPAFHFKILEDFVEVFNHQSETLVSKLLDKANGNVFNIFPYITLCTLDIICETAMGCNVHAQENSDSEYVKAISRMVKLLQHRMTRPWQQPGFLFKLLGIEREHKKYLKILHQFTRETIAERRKIYQEIKQNGISHVEEQDDFVFIGE
ncbi:Cytochrome P450 4V2 [Halocaridina rubra]|uniref:Cytochrome P450 4V2 n=1 Tax=Halocaridina rubra TaxID=373956 RepID=A0AAN9ACV0_HALRR